MKRRLPAFDPARHAALLESYRGRVMPAARDGRTHYCVMRDRGPDGTRLVEPLTAPLCGSPGGTQLHNRWEHVDCDDCREVDGEGEDDV